MSVESSSLRVPGGRPGIEYILTKEVRGRPVCHITMKGLCHYASLHVKGMLAWQA